MTKYIFVTGGVVSSLGKGITAASLGVLLKRRGYRVSIIKMDPYINVDAGAMSPFQHGEVFVTCDGAETDLDLGHYERFIDEAIMGENSCTTGKVYSSVIQRERAGGYNGATVQVIPHITNEIQDRIEHVGATKDVVIAEIGGTVGDIEGLPYLEAIRQFAGRVGRENILYCHVTLVPYIAASGELKTKPTQHSVNELRRIGIQPDVIVCRSQYPVGPDLREKIGLFCSVPAGAVFEAIDSDSIYRIPIVLHSQKFDNLVLKKLGMPTHKAPDMKDWKEFLHRYDTRKGELVVALVGKYTETKDAYLSVNEAVSHAGIVNGVKVKMFPVESGDLENGNVEEILGGADAILVPGGFGQRGVEGMIAAARSGVLTLDKLEAMTCVCSVGLDMIAVPGDTSAETISAIIADEAAVGMVNSKTTAVRLIPAPGKTVGDEVSFGGLLGAAPIMPVHPESSADFIARGGRIPAPMQSLKN